MNQEYESWIKAFLKGGIKSLHFLELYKRGYVFDCMSTTYFTNVIIDFFPIKLDYQY